GLYDASLREIHSLAVAEDGSIYALGLSEAASTTRAQTATAAEAAATAAATSSEETGAIIQAQPSPARSRNDLTNARSAVFHILPDGGSDVVWSSTSVTGFALLPAPKGVLLGTSDKGRIYAITDDGRDKLLLQSSEGQVSSMAARGSDVYVATSNQGKVFRYGESVQTEGAYESPVRDAKMAATWGRVWWR